MLNKGQNRTDRIGIDGFLKCFTRSILLGVVFSTHKVTIRIFLVKHLTIDHFTFYSYSYSAFITQIEYSKFTIPCETASWTAFYLDSDRHMNQVLREPTTLQLYKSHVDNYHQQLHKELNTPIASEPLEKSRGLICPDSIGGFYSRDTVQCIMRCPGSDDLNPSS